MILLFAADIAQIREQQTNEDKLLPTCLIHVSLSALKPR